MRETPGAVTAIHKATWVLGAIFMVTSITLAVWATRHTSGSVMERAPARTAPVNPAPVPANPAPAPAKK